MSKFAGKPAGLENQLTLGRATAIDGLRAYIHAYFCISEQTLWTFCHIQLLSFALLYTLVTLFLHVKPSTLFFK
jgi:hypothetical protein